MTGGEELLIPADGIHSAQKMTWPAERGPCCGSAEQMSSRELIYSSEIALALD
jgi:hypothetical protein